jgi:hypothetical protein
VLYESRAREGELTASHHGRACGALEIEIPASELRTHLSSSRDPATLTSGPGGRHRRVLSREIEFFCGVFLRTRIWRDRPASVRGRSEPAIPSLIVCRLSLVVCRLSSVVCRLSSVVCRLSSPATLSLFSLLPPRLDLHGPAHAHAPAHAGNRARFGVAPRSSSTTSVPAARAPATFLT